MIKKYLYSTLLVTTALCFGACKDSDDGGDDPIDTGHNIEIITDILTKAQVHKTFKANESLSVFATTDPNHLDGELIKKDVTATFDGAKWNFSQLIPLKEGGIPAYVYATSPVVVGVTDMGKIPVDITKQEDVLYSGAKVAVSYTSNKAKLTMKHALSLATFNISKQGYSGAGNLTKLVVEGTPVYSKGTLTVDKAKFTGTEKGRISVDVNKQINEKGWNTGIPNIWVAPFVTLVDTAYLHAVIDGKEYVTRFPSVEMKSGFQYIFRLILTRLGLEFIPSQTETISLNKEDDEMQVPEGYGLLTIKHNAPAFLIPSLIGDAPFGTIDWGDGTTESYGIGAVKDYGSKSNHVVVLESWNSTGFELKTLDGIEELDLSEY